MIELLGTGFKLRLRGQNNKELSFHNYIVENTSGHPKFEYYCGRRAEYYNKEINRMLKAQKGSKDIFGGYINPIVIENNHWPRADIQSIPTPLMHIPMLDRRIYIS